MFFLERSSQIQLFQNEKVIISHHKSTEVVKIVWFSHTSLLLVKKKYRKTDIFPVLGKLTHMYFLFDIVPTYDEGGEGGSVRSDGLDKIPFAVFCL